MWALYRAKNVWEGAQLIVTFEVKNVWVSPFVETEVEVV